MPGKWEILPGLNPVIPLLNFCPNLLPSPHLPCRIAFEVGTIRFASAVAQTHAFVHSSKGNEAAGVVYIANATLDLSTIPQGTIGIWAAQQEVTIVMCPGYDIEPARAWQVICSRRDKYQSLDTMHETWAPRLPSCGSKHPAQFPVLAQGRQRKAETNQMLKTTCMNPNQGRQEQ